MDTAFLDVSTETLLVFLEWSPELVIKLALGDK